MLARAAVLAAALALVIAGAADARGTKGDRDRDGLRDRVEAAAGLDPTRADTDGDGVRDGAEGAGRVVAVRGTLVTVKLLSSRTVRARLTSATRITCPAAQDEAPAEEEGTEAEGEEAPVEEASLLADHGDAGLDPPSLEEVLPEEADPLEESDQDGPAAACSADDVLRGTPVLGSARKGKGRKARWARLELAP